MLGAAGRAALRASDEAGQRVVMGGRAPRPGAGPAAAARYRSRVWPGNGEQAPTRCCPRCSTIPRCTSAPVRCTASTTRQCSTRPTCCLARRSRSPRWRRGTSRPGCAPARSRGSWRACCPRLRGADCLAGVITAYDAVTSTPEADVFAVARAAGLPVGCAPLHELPLADRNVAQGAGREQLLGLDGAVQQPLLEGVLQQRLDGGATGFQAVGPPVGA